MPNQKKLKHEKKKSKNTQRDFSGGLLVKTPSFQCREREFDLWVISRILCSGFKIGYKAMETTDNINNVTGPGTANQWTGQCWFKEFCKGDKSLEDEEHSGWPLEVDKDQLRAIMEADPVTTIWEVAQELNIDCSVITWHLKQNEKMKKLKKRVPHELTTNQKNCHFEVSSSLTLCNNNEQFLNQIVTVNFIQLMTRSAAGWKRSSKALPKAKVASKKGSQTLFGGLIHYSFLKPSETITSEKYAQQIDEIHWKLQGLQWELVHRKGPILLHDNARPHVTLPMLQKLNELGYKVLPYSPDLSPTNHHFFKQLNNFLQGKCFHN